ncbi:hypothetical protein QQF64_009603 [Cirrhinus molitorella]|uniref:Uncharacterized protein n=1 Tax=Cirrhinus molitorella TaxID=172907 RepID=A0ABR3M1M1_9TELE
MQGRLSGQRRVRRMQDHRSTEDEDSSTRTRPAIMNRAPRDETGTSKTEQNDVQQRGTGEHTKTEDLTKRGLLARLK